MAVILKRKKFSCNILESPVILVEKLSSCIRQSLKYGEILILPIRGKAE